MFKGILLVFFGACSYGILSTFVKLAYHEGYSLGDVTGIQAFLGALILWIIFFFQKIKKTDLKFKITRNDNTWWHLLVAGICTGLVSIFYYQCVKLVSNALAIVLLMQFIWMSVLLDYLIFKKKPTFVQVLAMVFVLGGTVLASGMLDLGIAQINSKGIVYGLLAALAYAGFLMLNGKLGNQYPALYKSALMVTGACIFIFIVFPPVFLFNGALHGSLLKWGIIIAVFGTVLPPIFYAGGVPKIGTALSSILSAAELPVAVLMAALVLHEDISYLRWLGVAIIISAIIISNIKYLNKTK